MEVNQLTKIIKKKTGMRIQDFAKEKLGIHYNLYRYRVLNDCLKLDDYHKICFYTGHTFEQLFQNPLSGGSIRKPITFNLARKPATTTITPLAQPQAEPANVMSHSRPAKKKDTEVSPKQEDIKKGEDINPPQSFEVVDPFGGNLPD